MPTQLGQSEITKHSRITIGLAATILVFIMGIAVSGIAEYDAIRSQISDLQKSQWTINEQLTWTLEIQKRNPSLDIPIPALSADAILMTGQALTQMTLTNTVNP